MTFSLSAYCPTSGQFGIAVTSSSIAVAARCAFARAGVGAVATQNITDPRLGPLGLGMMEAGAPAEVALERLLADNPTAAYRQVALVDAAGGVAHHSGARTLGVHAVAVGQGAVAAGNLLANPEVPAAVLRAFAAARDRPLGEGLLIGLEAGLAAGGEAGPLRSAGLLVVERESWPLVDLRVDWAQPDRPIADLRALWWEWEPQMRDYVTRALDPAAAPSYGVPGDR